MRILVVADIHGNRPALQALDEPHDVCLCLGDLVDYALEPRPVSTGSGSMLITQCVATTIMPSPRM